MTTQLATHPLEPDLLTELALLADPWTSLGKPFADKFRAACRAVADSHNGDVDPSLVRARLLGEPDWAPACGRDGFLDKTSTFVPISGVGSMHNQGKSVRLRVWRGWSA